MTNITERFSLDHVDHHELLAVLALRYKTCWRVSEREITFPAVHDYSVKVKTRHGQIEQISSGESLSQRELDELLEHVEADLKDDRIDEYGADILFARRPVTGAFRFSSVQMQIFPPPSDAPTPAHMMADHPFVLEYPVRRCRSPQVRILRHRKNAVEWAWVLNALLHGSIKYRGSRPRQLWAIESGTSDQTPFWAQEFYIVPGFQGSVGTLSNPDTYLPVVSADSYFGDTRTRANLPMDTFVLPDNIDALLAAYLDLDNTQRRRFLRSAAAVYVAAELWKISISSFFLACVQAIETLIDRPQAKPCPTCHKDTGPGPTRLFREFVEKYCRGGDTSEIEIRNLYSARSALAHGQYLFQFDEAPWALNIGASIASFHELEMSWSILELAKEGLRNWLIRADHRGSRAT